MQTQTKTPVQIIQELIAIHTSRIEMIQKCKGKSLPENVAKSFALAEQQSQRYTAELMSELSEFGDAVLAGVDQQNEYQVLYKEVLGQLDSQSPQETEQTFHSLENSLKNIYQTILQNSVELPDSLQEIISKQATGLPG